MISLVIGIFGWLGTYLSPMISLVIGIFGWLGTYLHSTPCTYPQVPYNVRAFIFRHPLINIGASAGPFLGGKMSGS